MASKSLQPLDNEFIYKHEFQKSGNSEREFDVNMHSFSVYGLTTKLIFVLLAKRALSDVLEGST